MCPCPRTLWLGPGRAAPHSTPSANLGEGEGSRGSWHCHMSQSCPRGESVGPSLVRGGGAGHLLPTHSCPPGPLPHCSASPFLELPLEGTCFRPHLWDGAGDRALSAEQSHMVALVACLWMGKLRHRQSRALLVLCSSSCGLDPTCSCAFQKSPGAVRRDKELLPWRIMQASGQHSEGEPAAICPAARGRQHLPCPQMSWPPAPGPRPSALSLLVVHQQSLYFPDCRVGRGTGWPQGPPFQSWPEGSVSSMLQAHG